jgi:hypothetical protein
MAEENLKPQSNEKPQSESQEPSKPESKSEFYAPYAEFAKTLRTWFVAYGIGGPVIFLSNDTALLALMKSGRFACIGLLFLLGGAVQVFSALLNKHSMWYLYAGDVYSSNRGKASYKLSSWYADQGWIDVVLDSVTVVLFGLATWVAFSAVVNTPVESLLPPQK